MSLGTKIDINTMTKGTLSQDRVVNAGQVAFVVDTGTANNYVVTLTTPPLSYVFGLSFIMRITHSNTGASVINVNSLGNQNIKKNDGTDPASGDLPANGLVELIYNGANFLIVSQIVGTTPSGSAGGDLSGTYPDPVVSQINGVAPAVIATSGSATDLIAGLVNTARLGTGTASSTTALFGDNTWKTVGGSSLSAAVITEEYASGTDMSSKTAGAWNALNFNHKESDVSSLLTLSSGRFTPVAGTYLLIAQIATFDTNALGLRIFNNTTSVVTSLSTTAFVNSAGANQLQSVVFGIIIANGTDVYEVDIWPHDVNGDSASVAKHAADLGAAPFATALGKETYSRAMLLKIG